MGTSQAALKVGGRRKICAVLTVRVDLWGFQAQPLSSSFENQVKQSSMRTPEVLDEKDTDLSAGSSNVASLVLEVGNFLVELFTFWGQEWESTGILNCFTRSL